MKPTKLCLSNCFLALGLMLMPLFLFTQEETVQVTVLNGDQIRCFDENFVEIEITPNPSLNYTQIQVYWDDTADPIILTPADEPLLLDNTYNLTIFEDDCTYGEGCPPGFVGFCFTLTVLVDYSDGDQENAINVLSFRAPPRPAFDSNDSFICAGETVTFNNHTCPSNDPEMRYYWVLPDGSTSMETEPNYDFDAPGVYPVSLTAVNTCDSVTITQDVVVNALPTAAAVLDSGSVAFQDDIYRICLADGGKVRLNGDESDNASFFEWGLSPSGAWEFVTDSENDTTCVQFLGEGMFEATLEVDNGCNTPDFASVMIEVSAPTTVSLEAQADTCIEVSYQPFPLLDGVIYTIDGIDYTGNDFPLDLVARPEPYVVTASLSSGFCPVASATDSFFVFSLVDPEITSPGMDTIICRDTSLLLLEVEGQGGQWQVSQGTPLIEDNGVFYFDLDQAPGVYEIIYSQGVGVCRREDRVEISLQSPSLSLDGPWEFCADGAITMLTASNPGGTWSGMGVIDGDQGLFDPTSVAPGTYDVFYSFTDASATGCTVTLSSSVTVVALPSINALPPAFSICDVDMELELEDLLGVTFSPTPGVNNWQGAGVVDMDSGIYNPSLVNGNSDTLVISYTIAPSCQVQDTTILSIDAVPAVDAGPDLTLCDNEDAPILNATPVGEGCWDGTGIDKLTGEIDLSQLIAGQTYQYIYTINPDFAPCRNSDTVQVTLASGEGVSVNPEELYICDTATFVVLPPASPSTGFWQGSPGISNDTLFLGVIPIDTFTLTYTEPGLPAACNSAQLQVYYTPQPSVSIVSDSTACVSVDCMEFAVQTGGAEAFSWDFGDGSESTLASTCHTYEDEGIYAVNLIGYLLHPVTNERYCASDAATTTVEILGALAPLEIVSSAPNGCPDFFVDMEPSLIDPRNIYTWTIAGITDSTTITLSDVLLTAATEDTTYVAYLTTSNGCETQVDSLSLIANAPLRTIIGTDFDFPCSGEEISFYNLSTGVSMNTPTWIIDGVPFNGFEPAPFQVFTDSLPRPLEVLLIDENDCNADTASYVIEIQPTDVRARMNYSDLQVCANGNLELINLSTPGAQVRWETSDGNSYTGDTVIHQFADPGPAWVVIYAEGCGYDSLQYEFEVLPPPTITLAYDSLVCAAETSSFVVGGNAAGHLLYYGFQGDSTNLTTSVYSYPEPGEYEIRLIGESQAECVDSLQATITVNPLPEAIVLPVDSVCVGEQVQLISQSIDAQSCVWRMGDGGLRDECFSSYIFSASGLQANRLIATSTLGCRDSVDFFVYVRPTPTAAFSQVGSDDCSPVGLQFIYTDTTPMPTSWFWDFGDNTTSNDEDPFHNYPFGGSYDISLIVGVDGICFDTIQETIQVRGTPQVDTLILDERCLPNEAYVIEVLTDPENEITLTGENYSQAGINRFEIVPAGTYELEILSPQGCDSTFTFNVPEVFPLEVSLMPDTTILLGASVRITSEVNNLGLNLNWFPVEGLSDTTILEPIAAPGATTTYFLTVSDGQCSAIDTVTIFVDEDVKVYFPNAFSPNSDGFNDLYTFYPAIGVEQVRSFQIFNRWGGMVFEQYDIDPPPAGVVTWDGTFQGKPVNPDTFVFVALLKLTNGKEVSFEGNIHLVR